MTACLCVAVLEIRKGVSPDWKAVADHLLSISLAELTRFVGNEDCDSPADERTVWGLMHQSFESVQEGWDGARADMSRMDGLSCDMLIAAEQTCGDPPEGTQAIAHFDLFGLAAIAGFLQESPLCTTCGWDPNGAVEEQLL